MRKSGRPLGPIAIAVLELLRQQRLTAREVAHQLHLSVDDAKKSCSRLNQYGLIYVMERRCVPWSHKPARVYTAAHGSVHPPALMVANSRVGRS